MTEPKNVIALSRFRGELSRALTRRARELLAAKDLRKEMEALAPLEAYFVIKEIGVEDALALVQNATEEQLQTFIDLDCWEDEKPSVPELEAWLAPFLSEGLDGLAQAFVRLEEEIQILYLGQALTIYDVRSEEAPETIEGVPRMTTPDTYFVVEPKSVQERELDPLVLVDALYKHSLDEAFRLLMAAKWEVSSETEETASQFRRGRLQDLGFPHIDEAMRIFSAPPHRPNTVQQFTGAHEGVTLPALYAAPLGETSLFTATLSATSDAHRVERLVRDLIYLVNCAVVAYGKSPRDVTYVGEVVGYVRDTLSLGLEELVGDGTPLSAPYSETVLKSAEEKLASYPLVDIFRYGFAPVKKLGQEAKLLAEDPVIASWLAKPETEQDDYNPERADRAFVRTLSARPHLWAGFEVLRPERKKAFASKQDVAEARERLSGLKKRLG